MPESVNERFGNRKEYRSVVKDMYDENEDFRITIDLSSPEPIYKQIYNDIVKNIAKNNPMKRTNGMMVERIKKENI